MIAGARHSTLAVALPCVLLVACAAAPVGPSPPEVDLGALTRLRFGMDEPDARAALEAAGASVEGEAEHFGKGSTRSLEVTTAKWRALLFFDDASLSRIRCELRSPESVSSIEHAASSLTRALAPAPIRDEAELVWQGPRTDLHVALTRNGDRLHIEEKWEVHESGTPCADGPRFRGQRGFRAFRWGAPIEEVERAAPTAKIRLGAWIHHDCLRDCGPIRRDVRFVAADGEGTLVFQDERLRSATLSADVELPLDAWIATYAERLDPPCKQSREMVRTWSGAARRVEVTIESPAGGWSASVEIAPP